VHEDFHGCTGIDLNRAGTPLLEIVSEPDMASAEEAVAYARTIHQLISYLSVSDGNLSQGNMRCDANVSIRRTGDDKLGTRTEIKNVNSFRFLEQAINYEIERQIEVIENGGSITQETRLYDPDRDETRSMRSKETAMDYRYFPEPDLLPVVINEAYIDAVRDAMPELPAEKKARYIEELKLPEADAVILAGDLDLATYFETCLTTSGDAVQSANWVKGELLANLKRADLAPAESPLSPKQLGTIIARIKDGTISGKIATAVFTALWEGETDSVDAYISDQGLEQVSDTSELEPIIDQIIADNPKQVEQFRSGKTKLLGFFVGQVMKQTGGKANPKQVNDLVVAKLG
jgi:aspartyl-tRNA(Asn)/glutamyl-tRNA(Gln) amidotransferase subunit B